MIEIGGILLLIIGIWILVYSIKLSNYSKERYSKTYQSIKLMKGPFADSLSIFFEVIKNSHREDKKYSSYINKIRLGYLALLVLIIILIFTNL